MVKPTTVKDNQATSDSPTRPRTLRLLAVRDAAQRFLARRCERHPIRRPVAQPLPRRVPHQRPQALERLAPALPVQQQSP